MLTARKRRGRGSAETARNGRATELDWFMIWSLGPLIQCFYFLQSPWESLKTLEVDAELSIGPTSDWEL